MMQKGTRMSHHLDVPAAREDGRVDLCDLYVFEGADPDTTVLIMTVNPDAGVTSPTSFHPDMVYEFKLDTDGDALEEVSYRFRFGEPNDRGEQVLTVLRALGERARSGADGEPLAQGQTNEEVRLITGGRVWAGLRADAFYADGAAAFVFEQAALTQHAYLPNIFEQGFNVFGGRNVAGIVLEVPTSALGQGAIGVWATTSMHGHGLSAQIERIGLPLIQPFFNIDDERNEAHNRRQPREDRADGRARIAEIVTLFSRLAGRTERPDAYGQAVADLLTPDILRYRLGTPASFSFATRNGRRLSDDAADVVLSLL
ncbi:MAG TPA: DUF4331 family protein, partial [Ktedonobacterales bacterium]|nr:DUF4331 family protein [Ktedonobacterales bacterium]